MEVFFPFMIASMLMDSSSEENNSSEDRSEENDSSEDEVKPNKQEINKQKFDVQQYVLNFYNITIDQFEHACVNEQDRLRVIQYLTKLMIRRSVVCHNVKLSNHFENLGFKVEKDTKSMMYTLFSKPQYIIIQYF